MRLFGSRAKLYSKKINHKDERIRDTERRNEFEIQQDFTDKYKSNIIKEEEITIRRIPYIFWTFGAVTLIIGFYLLYSIIIGPTSGNKLFNGLDHGYSLITIERGGNTH